MSDSIGRVTVPTPTASGLTFPLVPDMGYGTTRQFPVVTHRFGELATKAQQTFAVGIGPRRFAFRRQHLSNVDRKRLTDFYESVQGSYQSFTYNAPQADKSTTPTSVIFDTQPLSIQELVNSCQTGIVFLECGDAESTPSYTINSTCTRFPSTALQTALQSDVQQIIPLIHIKVREAGVYDIYLSDRRVTVGGNLYLPRLLGVGDPGSDVLISQNINGQADNVQFQFNNADRVMTQLANDTDLKFASIDLCFYHVNTGILLQLWKGFILSFQADGSAVFPIQCSDGLYQVTQQYPIQCISRTCWKTFNDGVNCPYSAHGSGGNGSSCDYYFDSTNGCQAHGMSQYFGGHPAQPQGVFIKDDSTGLFGFQRNRVTAVSIISDTAFGQPLPELWCNDDGNPLNSFICNAIMLDYRDESTFADTIGIVGAGPIGRFAVDDNNNAYSQGGLVVQNSDGYRYILAPMTDGFPCHGFKVDMGNFSLQSGSNAFGLRQVHGTDPVNPGTDSFSLGQGSPQVWGPEMAAGTAFAEIRIVKPSKLQPSTPDQHSMTVPISQGLGGRVWDSSGNASWVNGLTNPAWVAINCYLRAIGLKPDQSDNSDKIAAQLNSFVLSSVVAGDGSGAAEIADAAATPLVGASSTTGYEVTSDGQALAGAQVNYNPTGTYSFQYYDTDGNMTVLDIDSAVSCGYVVATSYPITERQFRFQGRLAQQKPFRDWLTEILATTLGYYTFEFGKLKLGVRENAGAVSAFTRGNMLFQSLNLTPIEAAFEKLIIDYADVAYQYQANTAEYQDKDHAAYFGRSGAPLTARQHSVGSSTLSQTLRLAATRTREEVGGVNATEWKNARNASWGTTILGLGTEVGQVVSVTHPDVPGGVANFRIQAWKLMKDWSIQIQAKTVTTSMYDLEVGPKPADVLPDPLPVMFYPQPQGQWAPYQVQASSSDALYPNEYTFDIAQSSTTLADGTVLANIITTGKLPANQFVPGCGPVGITSGSITHSTTGGQIRGGVTLRVAVCAKNAAGVCSPPSAIVLVQTPIDTNTNQFTINGIQWPQVSGLTGYVVFAADNDDLICAQQTGTGTPSSITVTGPISRSTWALPDPDIGAVRLKAKQVLHGGVVGAAVTSATGNTIVSQDTIDTAAIDNWAGRKLFIAGRNQLTTPFTAFNITAFDPATGTFTLDRSVTGIEISDVFMVAFKGYDNSSNPYHFADTGISNAGNFDPLTRQSTPHSGLTPSFEKGNIIRVIAGTNRGAMAKIVDNDTTGYTLDQALPIDATSIVVVEAPTWEYQVDAPVNNANPQVATNITIPTANFLMTSLLIAGFTVTTDGIESSDGDGPVRISYCFGSGGTRTITADDTQRVTDGRIFVDTTAGDVTFSLLPDGQVFGQLLLIEKISIDTNVAKVDTSSNDKFSNGMSEIVLPDQGSSTLLKF